ncbi:MAG: hypothetical protein WCK73_17440 [Deltaproteobacteria bacterium]
MNPVPPLRVVGMTPPTSPVQAPVAVLRKTFEPAPAASAPPASPPGTASLPFSSSLPASLRNLEGMRARLDDMLSQARRGRTFSPQELLCLQADSHRFAQTVEFSARAVEHGVQGLRQALNAQV